MKGEKRQFFIIGILLLSAIAAALFIQQRQTIKQHAADTTISFTIFLHGIGKGGDNANPTGTGNTDPKRPNRQFTLEIFNEQNQLVTTQHVTLTYDHLGGNFKGNLQLTTIPSGIYTFKIKSDQYLKAALPGIQTITTGTTNILPPATLITGDIDGNNKINIADYDILLGCYSDLTPAKNCIEENTIRADITDDGFVNAFDYNLFLRELLNRSGEPQPTTTTTPTTTNTPTPTVTPSPVVGGQIWKPTPHTAWQWQISGDAFNAATDMIAGVHMYDIDLFNNSAQVVTSIKQKDPQAKVICYMETGSWENYRPDASQYPSALLGKTLGGYPDEKFVDIRNINNPDSNSNQAKLRTIIRNRLQQCKDKGFDGIEPDLDDTYSYNTGFSISMADNVAFNKFVADEAHKRGLSIGLKNGSEKAFVQQMAPIVDWALNEQCFQYNECDALEQYIIGSGKAVFNAEYTQERQQTISQVVANVCPKANAMNFDTIIKKSSSNLDATRTACR